MVSFILVFLFLSTSFASQCDNASETDESPRWVNDGGFLILLLGVCAMFWGLAVVCEEYFVPALNIMCEELNVPDDVAGATFMAAGASSPEMFTSFIALFVNHSAIGVGTVVGSEIFNHMVICAGSVMYSKTGVLQLEKRVFSRDVAAYFFSLLFLIWALKGSVVKAIPHMFDSGEREKCLHVTVGHASGLVGLYVVYAIVSGNFQRLIALMCPMPNSDPDPDVNSFNSSFCMATAALTSDGDPERSTNGQTEEDRIALMLATAMSSDQAEVSVGGTASRTTWTPASDRLTIGEPSSLRRSLQVQRAAKYLPEGVSKLQDESSRLTTVDWSQSRATFVADTPLYTWRSSAIRFDNLPEECGENAVRVATTTSASGLPSCMHWLFPGPDRKEISTMVVSQQSLSVYLYERSSFYRMSCLPEHKKWSLRYFTIDQYGFHSRKERTSAPRGPHIQIVDMTSVHSVVVTNRDNGEFMINRSEGRPVEFKAPNTDILVATVERLEGLVAAVKMHTMEIRNEAAKIARRTLDGGCDVGTNGEELHHGDLLEEPKVKPGDPMSSLSLCWHWTIYPLKFMLYHTLPNVLVPGGRGKYILCLLMSVVWLALLSFLMIQCCDNLGAFIGASPIVMGLTLSAIGTSFPNLWSSMLVARQGLGDMAVSNAFGSNTFNICIALGLPWLVHVLTDGFKAYDKMQDDGIVFMLLLLLAVLIAFYVVVMLHKWQIRLWMSYYYIMVYFAIMIYAIING